MCKKYIIKYNGIIIFEELYYSIQGVVLQILTRVKQRKWTNAQSKCTFYKYFLFLLFFIFYFNFATFLNAEEISKGECKLFLFASAICYIVCGLKVRM